MLSSPALLLSLAVSAQLLLPARCVHPLWFSPGAASNCGQFTSPDSEAGAGLAPSLWGCLTFAGISSD